jgi:hypothetical protein
MRIFGSHRDKIRLVWVILWWPWKIDDDSYNNKNKYKPHMTLTTKHKGTYLLEVSVPDNTSRSGLPEVKKQVRHQNEV